MTEPNAPTTEQLAPDDATAQSYRLATEMHQAMQRYGIARMQSLAANQGQVDIGAFLVNAELMNIHLEVLITELSRHHGLSQPNMMQAFTARINAASEFHSRPQILVPTGTPK